MKKLLTIAMLVFIGCGSGKKNDCTCGGHDYKCEYPLLRDSGQKWQYFKMVLDSTSGNDIEVNQTGTSNLIIVNGDTISNK